ncbi:hypothetical protein JK151_17925 (plasmid) [Ralstonia syzygii subsp. celebesensis]|nr:hypothetical protein JK151_17925 [Ralstonia syzygii subsp. celebesensis]
MNVLLDGEAKLFFGFSSQPHLVDAGHIPCVVATLRIDIEGRATGCDDLDAEVLAEITASLASQPVAGHQEIVREIVEFRRGEVLGLSNVDLAVFPAAHLAQIGRLAGEGQALGQFSAWMMLSPMTTVRGERSMVLLMVFSLKLASSITTTT